MQNTDPIYVAETDELGHVVWVWCVPHDGNKPRAISDRAKHLDGLAKAKFFGAKSNDITRWFADGAVSSGSDVKPYHSVKKHQ